MRSRPICQIQIVKRLLFLPDETTVSSHSRPYYLASNFSFGINRVLYRESLDGWRASVVKSFGTNPVGRAGRRVFGCSKPDEGLFQARRSQPRQKLSYSAKEKWAPHKAEPIFLKLDFAKG